MKAYIATLGCRSNQYDSSAIEDILKENNFQIVKPSERPDVCIINTCTVTGKTDYQSRQLIRRAIAANPDAVVLVTGCYVQVSPEDAAGIEGVDYIVGNQDKQRILEYILEGKQKQPKVAGIAPTADTTLGLRARGASGRTRANLKVQDGCNNSCSYCIIPKGRGVSRSLPLSDVILEIDGLVANGYREIILTGIHLGSYGLDLIPKADLAALVRAINDRDYPSRFRISSLDPDEVSDELIEIMADSKSICNHLHLPLQSGDDDILKKMNRRYDSRVFAERVERIARIVPDVCIGVDVIVGFPGEGEREFLNTLKLLEGLPVAYMHIFPFSVRKGTAAADFSERVDGRVVKERCEMLRGLDEVKREKFYGRCLGNRASVLIESSRDRETGFLTGRSKNYIPFLVKGGDELKNSVVDVIGKEICGKRIIGYAINE